MGQYPSWKDGREFKVLEGQTLSAIDVEGNEEIKFVTDDGKLYLMYHSQDCCEHVYIKDIVGDLEDLIGTPILTAEERVSHEDDAEAAGDYDESFTWTFYTLRTIKGSVDISWYGCSNGYYSESVDFGEVKMQPTSVPSFPLVALP